jgi:hypothetical protein
MALASLHSIRHAAAVALGIDARPPEELVEALECDDLSLGSDPGERLRRALLDDSRFHELESGEWVHLPSLIDGTTWTTRVPEPAPPDDQLPSDPDLAMLAWCTIAEPVPLAGGARSSRWSSTTDATVSRAHRAGSSSDARADEARTLVASLLPGAVLEDDDVRSLHEVFDDADAAPSPGAPDDPMLEGLTPREAAVDPIGRVELDRLLRQYEDRSGGPGTFDVSRLRRLLDLS